MRRLSRWIQAWALVLLASIGALAAQDAFAHTDDGCAVEIHCLACRWAVHRTVAPDVPPSPVPVLVAAGSAALPRATAIAASETDASGTRGPPSCS